jgi:hypothetical protein
MGLQNEAAGGNMSACNFEYLLRFVNDQLDLDGQLEVYDHLDRCNICREAVYQLSRDLDGVPSTYRAHSAKHHAFPCHIETARSAHAQVSAKSSARPTMRKSSNRPQ